MFFITNKLLLLQLKICEERLAFAQKNRLDYYLSNLLFVRKPFMIFIEV